MMVQVRFTNNLYKFVHAKDLKVAADWRLYFAGQHNIFVVDEVLNYASVN